MATNFRVKMGEIGRPTRLHSSPNEVVYRNSDFKRFICDDLATLYKNLVNVGLESCSSGV